MVSGIDTLLYYQLTSADTVSALSGTVSGDTLGTQILDKKIQDADGAGFFSGTFPAVVGGAITNISLSGKSGDGLDNTISGNCVYVYDSTLDRIVAQLPPFIASTGGGGPFSNPNVVTTNTTVSRVDLTANLSGGPGTTASFDGDVNISGSLGVSGDVTVSGDIFVSGGTISVCSQDSVASGAGDLPILDTLICPSPPGAFCFLSSVGDGTATASEVNFGEGTTVQAVSSVGRAEENGYYAWHSVDNTIYVSANGIYKVDFVGITEVAAAITITISFYTGSTLVHRFDLRVHSVTDPHNLVGSWVGFVRTTEPISVTINSGSGDNAQLMESSTLFVQRLA